MMTPFIRAFNREPGTIEISSSDLEQSLDESSNPFDLFRVKRESKMWKCVD